MKGSLILVIEWGKMTECLFCSINKFETCTREIVAENASAYAVRDGYPVTHLHTLIVPKRHVESYFDLRTYEKIRCDQLLSEMREQILVEDTLITGFNIGINVGSSAGQTIFHCHIHLVPRRDEDVENPRGGVRGVIPDKQKY